MDKNAELELNENNTYEYSIIIFSYEFDYIDQSIQPGDILIQQQQSTRSPLKPQESSFEDKKSRNENKNTEADIEWVSGEIWRQGKKLGHFHDIPTDHMIMFPDTIAHNLEPKVMIHLFHSHLLNNNNNNNQIEIENENNNNSQYSYFANDFPIASSFGRELYYIIIRISKHRRKLELNSEFILKRISDIIKIWRRTIDDTYSGTTFPSLITDHGSSEIDDDDNLENDSTEEYDEYDDPSDIDTDDLWNSSYRSFPSHASRHRPHSSSGGAATGSDIDPSDATENENDNDKDNDEDTTGDDDASLIDDNNSVNRNSWNRNTTATSSSSTSMTLSPSFRYSSSSLNQVHHGVRYNSGRYSNNTGNYFKIKEIRIRKRLSDKLNNMYRLIQERPPIRVPSGPNVYLVAHEDNVGVIDVYRLEKNQDEKIKKDEIRKQKVQKQRSNREESRKSERMQKRRKIISFRRGEVKKLVASDALQDKTFSENDAPFDIPSDALQMTLTMEAAQLTKATGHLHYLTFVLFGLEEQTFVSEEFAIQVDVNNSRTVQNNRRVAIFKDIGRRMFQERLVLVCRVYRQGPLASKSQRQPFTVRQPIALGLTALTPYAVSCLLRGESGSHGIKLREIKDSNWTDLRSLISSGGGSGSFWGDTTIRVQIHKESYQEVINASSNSSLIAPTSSHSLTLIQMLQFPDTFTSGDWRHDFYVRLNRGEIRGCRSIEATVYAQVNGERKSCLTRFIYHHDSPSQKLRHQSQIQSAVLYSIKKPVWMENIRINLDPTQLPQAELIIEIRNVKSKTGPELQPSGIGRISLSTPEGVVIPDFKDVEIPIVRWEANNHNEHEQIGSIYVDTLLLSNQLSNTLNVHNLIHWRKFAHDKDKIKSILADSVYMDHSEFLKFSRSILNSLFEIADHDATAVSNVFRTLLKVIENTLVSQRQSRLEEYISKQFQSAHAHKWILQMLASSLNDSAVKIKDVVKHLSILLRFAARSHSIYEDMVSHQQQQQDKENEKNKDQDQKDEEQDKKDSSNQKMNFNESKIDENNENNDETNLKSETTDFHSAREEVHALVQQVMNQVHQVLSRKSEPGLEAVKQQLLKNGTKLMFDSLADILSDDALLADITLDFISASTEATHLHNVQVEHAMALGVIARSRVVRYGKHRARVVGAIVSATKGQIADMVNSLPMYKERNAKDYMYLFGHLVHGVERGDQNGVEEVWLKIMMAMPGIVRGMTLARARIADIHAKVAANRNVDHWEETVETYRSLLRSFLAVFFGILRAMAIYPHLIHMYVRSERYSHHIERQLDILLSWPSWLHDLLCQDERDMPEEWIDWYGTQFRITSKFIHEFVSCLLKYFFDRNELKLKNQFINNNSNTVKLNHNDNNNNISDNNNNNNNGNNDNNQEIINDLVFKLWRNIIHLIGGFLDQAGRRKLSFRLDRDLRVDILPLLQQIWPFISLQPKEMHSMMHGLLHLAVSWEETSQPHIDALSLAANVIISDRTEDGRVESSAAALCSAVHYLIRDNEDHVINNQLLQKLEQQLQSGTKIECVMISDVAKLIGDMRDVWNLSDDIEHEDRKTNAIERILNVLQYGRDNSSETVYALYVNRLAEMHLSLGSKTEAAISLLLHADRLRWDGTETLSKLCGMPRQLEGERKASLYERAMNLTKEDKEWGLAIELCRSLVEYRTLIRDYRTVSSLLSTQSEYFEKVAEGGTPHVRMLRWYLVEFYGPGFPDEGLTYVYKRPNNVMFGDFLKQLQQQYPQAQIMGKLPEELEPDQLYIIRKGVEISSEEDMNSGIQTVEDAAHERPSVDIFVMSTSPLERRYYKTYGKFYTTTRRLEARCVKNMTLTKLRNAVNNVKKQILDIEQSITNYKRGVYKEKKRGWHLQMFIKGAVSAEVHGGPVQYAEEFLVPEYTEQHPEEHADLRQLAYALQKLVSTVQNAISFYDEMVGDKDELYLDLKRKTVDMKKQLVVYVSHGTRL